MNVNYDFTKPPITQRKHKKEVLTCKIQLQCFLYLACDYFCKAKLVLE